MKRFFFHIRGMEMKPIIKRTTLIFIIVIGLCVQLNSFVQAPTLFQKLFRVIVCVLFFASYILLLRGCSGSKQHIFGAFLIFSLYATTEQTLYFFVQSLSIVEIILNSLLIATAAGLLIILLLTKKRAIFPMLCVELGFSAVVVILGVLRIFPQKQWSNSFLPLLFLIVAEMAWRFLTFYPYLKISKAGIDSVL